VTWAKLRSKSLRLSGEILRADAACRLGAFPEKWTPVFRRNATK
jgi:hypothetical protein